MPGVTSPDLGAGRSENRSHPEAQTPPSSPLTPSSLGARPRFSPLPCGVGGGQPRGRLSEGAGPVGAVAAPLVNPATRALLFSVNL